MTIVESDGFLCEFSDEETAKIQDIADRYGVTLEKAVKIAIENFLKPGVQTPKKHRRRCAA